MMLNSINQNTQVRQAEREASRGWALNCFAGKCKFRTAVLRSSRGRCYFSRLRTVETALSSSFPLSVCLGLGATSPLATRARRLVALPVTAHQLEQNDANTQEVQAA